MTLICGLVKVVRRFCPASVIVCVSLVDDWSFWVSELSPWPCGPGEDCTPCESQVVVVPLKIVPSVSWATCGRCNLLLFHLSAPQRAQGAFFLPSAAYIVRTVFSHVSGKNKKRNTTERNHDQSMPAQALAQSLEPKEL